MRLYALETQTWANWPDSLVIRETTLADDGAATVRRRRYVPLQVASIETVTEDGIIGMAWCSSCGGRVHRTSRFCQHCGAVFASAGEHDADEGGCAYCRHESQAYVCGEDGAYRRVAEELLHDDCCCVDAEPVISWSERNARTGDYADHAPRLIISAYDSDGDECNIAIPIDYCPKCGRRLPKTTEVYGR